MHLGNWRIYRGMVDMGRMGWPRPRAVVLQDRITSTEYLLSHDSSEPVLLTPVPTRANARPEEPILRAPVGLVRLFVSDGVFGYEIEVEQIQGIGASKGREDEPVFTLNYSDQRTTYKITADEVRAFGDPLCLTRYTNMGRVTVIEDLGCNFVLESVEVVVFEEGVFEEGVFV